MQGGVETPLSRCVAGIEEAVVDYILWPWFYGRDSSVWLSRWVRAAGSAIVTQQRPSSSLTYAVGNAMCRLGRVVIVYWIAEAAMQFDSIVGSTAMSSGMCGNAAMTSARGCGSIDFNPRAFAKVWIRIKGQGRDLLLNFSLLSLRPSLLRYRHRAPFRIIVDFAQASKGDGLVHQNTWWRSSALHE